jgi:adenylate cyclase
MRSLFSLLVRVCASRRSVGVVVLALLIVVRISDPAPLAELKLRSFDLFQTIAPRSSEFRPVVIVDIDEASLSAYGQWPWPRTLVADLLARLFELQSAAVAFDVIFPEPDRTSPSEAMKYFSDLDDATRARLLQLPSNDDVLAKTIARGKVVLGQAGTRTVGAASTEMSPQSGIATIGPDPAPYLISFPRLLRNLPQLERAAAGRGLFTIAAEQDGIVRRVPLVMRAEDRIVPALSIDLLRVVSGAGSILIRSDASGVRSVAMPGLEMPTDQNGRVWVYFGQHDMTRYVSAKDVIEGKASPDRFAQKLVLIGTSAVGLLDVKTTPVHAAMPGVEIHAQLIEAALTNSLLNAPAYAKAVEVLAVIGAGLVLIVLAPMVSALTLFLIAAVTSAGFLGASWQLFSGYKLLLDPTFPLIATLSVYMSLALLGYFREQVDRHRIRSAFAQYLSPSLVEELANAPHKLVLGGQEKTMTVLFSDVRGFTTIAEQFARDPQGLTALMNRFLTPLTNVIIGHNGTIDKYMGDAIMAFWNAPLDDESHESNACRAALDMMGQVEALNQERAREASEAGVRFQPIRMGIGINTGRCVVGNMGSELRFQYTVMGDSVNLASRLEGQTAALGVPMLIGEKTAQAVSDKFAVLQVDSILVKGKTDPEDIYTVVGGSDVAGTQEFQRLRELWDQCLQRYKARDWTGAAEMVDQCRPLFGKFEVNGLADLYDDRIHQFKVTPPPDDWDGVFVARTKGG